MPIDKVAQICEQGNWRYTWFIGDRDRPRRYVGKLVAESGAAQKIALTLRNIFGYKYLPWAMSH